MEMYVAFSTTVCHDIAARMIFAGAPEERVVVFDSNDPTVVFEILKKIDVEVVYVVTNMKRVKAFKAFFEKGGKADE